MATALITGASAGIGRELARCFAADGHDVVLVARRRERLDELANELRSRFQIRAHAIACDLTQASAIDALLRRLQELGLEIEFLVNNAGAGVSGSFAELELGRQLEFLELNVTAVLRLTRALLPPMLARRRGRILNVGSTAGFQPGPFLASYYASKAYVNSFSEALHFELRDTGVSVTLSCPGPTLTEFAGLAGIEHSRLFQLSAAPADRVARQAYAAMLRGRALVIHGALNRFGVQLLRISPRAAVRWVTAALNRSVSAPEEARGQDRTSRGG
ncbi:MAG TPA: SDR family oxidoreductase [Polyangiaceae bacterium]|nr:SDR family oxidoreductase [Polyangiaceae bacterium]